MPRDGPEGPELPHGRRQPEDEERGFLWPPTPGELALCVLLFILFFAFSWEGLVLWDEVFINTSDTAAETSHAVLTGAGRMAVSTPGGNAIAWVQPARASDAPGAKSRRSPSPCPGASS